MYTFNEKDVFEKICNDWYDFMQSVHASKCIIGISGGIDSTCVAALACKIFGNDNVIGLSLPCDGQKDMDDVNKVFDCLKIKRLDFDIGDAYHEILNGISNNAIDVRQDTKINLPARLRMASLYAFSQSIPNSLVINTCNLSESLMGYDTLWGDDCGSYAPIKNLTKSEVRKIAKFIGVPDELVMKIPIDGLQASSDEERFGFTYSQLDEYIRNGFTPTNLFNERNILSRFNFNRFKLEMVNIKGPDFDLPDYIQMKNIK